MSSILLSNPRPLLNGLKQILDFVIRYTFLFRLVENGKQKDGVSCNVTMGDYPRTTGFTFSF